MNILENGTPVLNDGLSEEMQAEMLTAFALSDFSVLVATRGADAIMNELFQKYPDVYGLLCLHFYQDFYKPVEEGMQPARVYS